MKAKGERSSSSRLLRARKHLANAALELSTMQPGDASIVAETFAELERLRAMEAELRAARDAVRERLIGLGLLTKYGQYSWQSCSLALQRMLGVW